MSRAEKILNPLESLTLEEKERLGFLIMWALDGPEQGFITNRGVHQCKLELLDFFTSNGVQISGQWVYESRRILAKNS